MHRRIECIEAQVPIRLMRASMASSFAHERANRLHEEGQELSSSANDDEALRRYHQALDLEPERPATLYNIELIHKYRREWRESFDYNLQAYRLRPDDEATRWNLAIAATALRERDTARLMWHECGIKLSGESGPISMNFGQCPVRLNPHEDDEVVWGTRIDPVRALLPEHSASGVRLSLSRHRSS